jgi:hypothetical protein
MLIGIPLADPQQDDQPFADLGTGFPFHGDLAGNNSLYQGAHILGGG